jgi:hypothetical protein
MKKTLFHIISWSTYALVVASDKGAAALTWVIAWSSAISRWLIASGGQILMQKFTPEQWEEVRAQIQLESQQTELELLSSVSKLKEHAIETGNWTNDHTDALTAVGNALLNDCDWDEEHVHQYLKEVVESVPGLKYSTPEDPFDGPLD